MHSSNRIEARSQAPPRRLTAVLATLRRKPLGLGLRYGAAVLAVAAGFLLRASLSAEFGPGLPPFFTFYPAAMLVALLAGFGPGLLAAVLCVLAVDYWILAPVGRFAVASVLDRLDLALFAGMSLGLSVVAGLYRRVRAKASAYDRHWVLRKGRREQVFLAKLLEGASQPFVVAYPDGRLGLCNRAFQRLTGYSAPELRSLDWTETLTPPEWREPERQQLQELRRTGQPVRYPKEYLRKDGSRVAVELLVQLIRDPAGGPESYCCFPNDIGPRQQAERELRELSQRLSYHVDHSPLAVIEWGPDMRLIRWSGEAERIFGWKAEEVLGRRMEEFRWVYPEDAEQVSSVSGELMTGANPRRFSANRNYRKDGSVAHCEWYNSSLVDPSGRLRSILSLVLDVTERKRMEATLQEEARRKDEFLALLGHELRNPLAPITTAVHLLGQGRLAPEAAERTCAILQRQVSHLARLVDDLLDISRITRGRIELKRERLDLEQTVRGVLADYQPVLEEHGLALDARFEPGPFPIEADRARIVQAVSNLLHNAIKFTDAGGRIGVSVAMHPSGWACVRVEDSGPGLRPEQLDLVFEPFRQGPEFIGRSRGGLGLGLALVKGLVALHGGQVSVTSAGPGRGSQFTIRLPLLQAPCPAPAPAPAEASPVSAGAGAHRVLIVEDMADSALTLQLLLRTLGHTAQTAADGHAGLDQARRFNPDVILCDIGLPGSLSGYDVARTLRALPESKGVLLIALSGFGTPADKRRAAEAGFDLHLTKPVDPAILETLLGSAGPP